MISTISSVRDSGPLSGPRARHRKQHHRQATSSVHKVLTKLLFLAYSFNPVRANQSSRLDPLVPGASKKPGPLPVSVYTDLPTPHRPRDGANTSFRRSLPPPPSVEDEEDSVAKEWNGSVVSSNAEEPQHRGSLEQLPIILPVPENNPERRFVLVTPSETDQEHVPEDAPEVAPTVESLPPSPLKTAYPANIKVQLDPKTSRDTQPALQKRPSKADLPRLETDVHRDTQPRSPRSTPHVQRTKSATCVDQNRYDAQDYFGTHSESARPATDAYLSPVIKHATKGRDRAYWNFNPGANVSSPRGSAPNLSRNSTDNDGAAASARSNHSAGPAPSRRAHADSDLGIDRRRPIEAPSSGKDRARSRSRYTPQSPSPSSDRRYSPPRLSRRDSSPVRSRGEPPRKLDRNRASYQSRSSPPREDLNHSSDEYNDRRERPSHRKRRKSTVIQEDRPTLLSPMGPRPVPVAKSRSRPPSPLPSPKSSQMKFPDYDSANPRSSATIITNNSRRNFEADHPVSPTSPGTDPSPRSRSRLRADDRLSDTGRPRASSRTPSIRSNASYSKPANAHPSTTSLSVSTPAGTRDWQEIPPSPAYSRQGSLEVTQQSASYWQPEPFCPPQQQPLPTPRNSAIDLVSSDTPIISLRRYSEEVNTGSLPGLPECHRQRPRAGLDWFTIPRYENFCICRSCYEQVFYATEFRDHFVLAPSRFRDKEISCDLGTSPWYRIAWLMTRKYRRSDLSLIQAMADLVARQKLPCSGPSRITRVWYSIIDPETRRCIPKFTVCRPCAEAVEMLFPSLRGEFVSADRAAEPRPGKCSLHFTPSRNRFLTYFDALESTHDHAVYTGTAPRIQRLAKKISLFSDVDECPRDEPHRNMQWYMMAHIPEMTVCEECFLDVVYPELETQLEAAVSSGPGKGADVSPVVRNFYQEPHTIKHSTVCQMASPRMRDLFRRACRREDGIEYLDTKVQERLRAL